MSVGSIIGGGFSLFRNQPRVVAIWAALYAVLMTLGMLAMRPSMAAMFDMQRQIAANAALGIKTPPVFPAEAFRGIFGLELVFGLLVLVAFAAVVRAVARPGGDRFAYLRIGMDELRLVGLGLLLMLLVFAAEIAAVIVIGLLVALSVWALGKIAAVVVGIVLAIALICLAIYAEVRISLAAAMTVLEGRIVIKDAWRASKGHFWTLFGVYFLIGLAYFVATLIILAITSPHLLTAYASSNPQAVLAAAQAQLAGQYSGFSLDFVVQMILGVVVAVPMGVILFGATATAALELGGVRASVAAEFA